MGKTNFYSSFTYVKVLGVELDLFRSKHSKELYTPSDVDLLFTMDRNDFVFHSYYVRFERNK